MRNVTSEKRAICGVCPAGCWIIAGYDDEGRLSAVRPEEGAAFGITCQLGDHAPAIVYAESRLRYPLRRKGPKGTHIFERISWDDAYTIIVENLNRIKAAYGPETAAIYTGRGSFELAMCDVFQPRGVAVSSASSVLFPFGSPNTFGVGSLCYVSFAMIAPHVTMGGMLIDMFSDIENAELIVVWGANPATDSPPLDFRRVAAAVERGARLVVIDPRRTRTAKLPGADWIPIRPGTDGALALGLCQVLIEEKRIDEAFVCKWVHGFEAFAEYTQHFRPEMVETITGVPAATIRSLARRIAGAKGAAPIMYTGLEYSDSGVQAIRATFVLWALAGQLDVPGGRCFRMRQNRFQINREGLVSNPDVRKALGRDRFPLYNLYRDEAHLQALPDAVLRGRPHEIRSLIILGASIITSWPQPEIWKRTLAGLDFLTCIDVQLTADAAYADLVLPAATLFEIESYMTYGAIFRIRERVVPPLGESRNIFFIMAELARRLGYGHLYPQNEEELLRHVLKGTGFTTDDVRAAGGSVRIPKVTMAYRKWEAGLLRSDGKPGFDTPTGKFEIASTILAAHGYDALPVYTEPREGPLSQPNLARRFPLVFNSGSRVTTDFRSQFHGIPELTRERPAPTVTLHPHDAAVRGISNGDMVCIRTLRGQVIMRAVVTGDIIAGTIDANMGGGGPVGPKAWQKNNVNALTDLDRYDPISGFPVYKALLCEIEKAPERTTAINAMDSGESVAATVDASTMEMESEASCPHIYRDHNATTPVAPEVREVMASLPEIIRCPSSHGHDRMKQEVLAGLSERQKRLPCKYFYDAHGSQLFEKICTQPEYYLPRTERAILEVEASVIMAGFHQGSLIELGSGASLKIRHLLAALPDGGRDITYVPVDLCEPALRQAALTLTGLYPVLALRGVIADYTGGLKFLEEIASPRLITFLGSNIGNFSPDDCTTFLAGLRRQMNQGDRLIVGFDLVKEKAVLEAAYNDSQGSTAAFNCNILTVINRELGGDFNPAAFEHIAFYNEAAQQIEMHLRTKSPTMVNITNIPMRISLAADETIFTEICRKFTRESVAELAQQSAFNLLRWWNDPRQWFALAEFVPTGDGGY